MKLKKALLCFFALWGVAFASTASDGFPEQFPALTYVEAGGWVPERPSPATVCAEYASVWGWDKNGYTASLIQDQPGLWRCQRYYNGALEPSWYTFIRGRCQDSGATPLTALTGKYVSHPEWREDLGKCLCSAGKGFKGDIQWCVPKCPAGQANNPDTYACVSMRPIFSALNPPSCGASPPRGNPIWPLRGIKTELVDTGLQVGRLPLAFTYDSTPKVPKVPAGADRSGIDAGNGVLGELWSSNYHRRVSVSSIGAGSSPSAAFATRGNGVVISMGSSGGQYVPEQTTADKFVAISGGGYRYQDSWAKTYETYNDLGRLIRISWVDGGQIDFSYSNESTPPAIAPVAGLLVQATDERGRSLKFVYQAGTGSTVALLKSVANETGVRVALNYDGAGRLASMEWPDGKTRALVYDHPTLPWALTAVFDESEKRYASFGYSSDGIATSTEHAGSVQRYSTSYSAPPRIKVSDQYDASAGIVYRRFDWETPSGVVLTGPTASSSWTAINLHGKAFLTSATQPAGAGCSASANALSYDANGNPASQDDFNGNRTCRVFDLGRNLPTTSVEGLSNTAACSGVTPANAILPAGSRKTSLQWHPDWSLETKRAEPGRLITSVYNGQPDPFASGAIASCAPASAVLPDGKPIAVLCKQVEQATTDVDGSKGFSAVLQSGVVNRVWTYTYNARGQVLTAKSPRADVNETTTYAYYEDTTAEHTLGDLKSVTNAKNQVTQYPLYTKSGQVLRMIDANNVVTDYTYDLRQRLKTITTAGRLVTSIDYHPTGQLKRATQADGSFVDYGYDDAQRLTSVSDHLGNRIEYTLDNAGNKIEETVKDPAGALTRQMSQVMDALSRVQQSTGRN